MMFCCMILLCKNGSMAMTNMAVVAAMQLQPFKCNIVPCVQWSDSDRDRIKVWLEPTLPGWSKFNVDPVAEYLGFILGPAAKDHQ